MSITPSVVMEQALSYATDAAGQIDGLMSQVDSALGANVTSYQWPGVEALADYTGAAGMASQMLGLGVADDSPSFEGKSPSSPGPGSPGTVTATVPSGGFTSLSHLSFNPPSMPSPFTEEFTRAEPAEEAVTLPPAPTIVERTSPTISFPTFPEALSLNVQSPNFGTLSFATLIAPVNSFNFSPDVYASTLLDPLKSALLDSLENGTFINPQLWTDTWNRAKDRRTELMAMELDDAARNMARSGFVLPNSNVVFVRNNILRKFTGEMLDVDREAAIKESDAHIENRKFTVQEIRQMEQISMDFHIRSMELMLNSMKAALEIAVLVFEAELKKHSAYVEEYKLEHERYLTTIEAEFKRAEIWKTQMEGVKIETEAQMVQVELYKAQLEGDKQKIELYKAQLEGALAILQINQMRVSILKAYAEVFATRVAAKESEYKGYAAAAQAEGVKAEFMKAEAAQYAAQADAMMAQVNAAKATLDAAIANIQAQADVYRSDVAAYGSDVQKYGADVQLVSAKYQGTASVRSSALSATPGLFGAEASAHSGVRNAEAQLSGAHGQFLSADIANQVNLLQAKASAGTAGAQALAALLVGALGMVNTLSAEIKTEETSKEA